MAAQAVLARANVILLFVLLHTRYRGSMARIMELSAWSRTLPATNAGQLAATQHDTALKMQQHCKVRLKVAKRDEGIAGARQTAVSCQQHYHVPCPRQRTCFLSPAMEQMFLVTNRICEQG